MWPSSGSIFVLIWTYSQVAQAYTTFEPECTNPKEAVNFVSSPPTRGTLDILWSSLFTIFACTWTVLHLNVPEQRDDRDPGVRGDIKWKMKAFWGKAKWMLTTVVAPEFLLYFGTSRLLNSREQHPKIKAFADADQVPWTLVHTTFADMGGFVVRGMSDRVGKDLSGSEMSATPVRSQVTNEWYILDLDTILKLRSGGHITLPSIPKAEIDDHSKGDIFTKGIAAAQIIWTISGTITRAIRGLAISQLEISVIAFAVCALLIYACYWSSPKDVSVPITFLQWEGPIPIKIAEVIRIDGSPNIRIDKTAFSNDTARKPKSDLDFFTLLLGVLFFGGPHLLAWNFAFPTPVERTIWRAASLYCSMFGIILVMIYLIGKLFPSISEKQLDNVMAFLAVPTMATYALARLFLIAEMFRTLFFLPPSAYIATWTANAPMFG